MIPKFYLTAANILKKSISGEASLKGLVISSPIRNKRRLLKLLCSVLEYREAIEEIIQRSEIFKYEKKSFQGNQLVLLIVLYEHLFCPRGMQCKGTPKEAIMRHKSRIHSEMVKIKLKKGAQSNKDLISEDIKKKNELALSIPRYVRVNLNVTTMEETIRHFKEQDKFTFITTEDELNAKMNQSKTFWRDQHLDDLLVFPNGTNLINHEFYLSGAIILQDKASCFPAYCLSPKPESTCLDACAAPGNKTSHLASIMRNTGVIYAFDMDKKRLNLLKRLTNLSKCKNISAACQNFLEVDPNSAPFNEVEYILLDPSCSGSGIISRMDHLTNIKQKGDEENRISSLSEFQIKMLNHAMKFPRAKKISYSTCSIHDLENEIVCEAALAENTDWKLINVLPSWNRRGLRHEEVIRALPTDGTNGFFVAMFSREPPENN